MLKDYLRLTLFFCFTMTGIQVPGLVDLYGDQLKARLDESQGSLLAFQDEADRFFAGSIEQMIVHYQSSEDPVFQAGGESLQVVYDRVQYLLTLEQAYSQNHFSAVRQALLSGDDQIRQDTLDQYDYQIRFTHTALIWGLVSGLVLTVLLELLVKVVAWSMTPRRPRLHGRRPF